MIAGSVLGGLFGPAFAAEALIRAFRGELASAGAWRVAGDVAIYTLMVSGLLTVLAPALVAARRRELTGGLVLASLPIYYILISAATWAAVFDLAVRPFYWAKTEHGRSGVAIKAPPPHVRPEAAWAADALFLRRDGC